MQAPGKRLALRASTARVTLSHLACLALVAALATLSPAVAQYEEDDEQTDRHAAQDAAYLQRIKDRKDKAVEGASTRETFLVRANALIRDKNFNSASNDHFTIRTDDPRLRPEAVLELFESFRTFFDGYWAADRELKASSGDTPIFLFYSFHKYNQLLDTDFSRTFRRPAGHFAPGLDVVFAHTDSGEGEGLPETLVHELTHQLVFTKLGWIHGSAPPWLVEGIASYFGYTYRNPKGLFQPGEIGGKNVVYFKGESASNSSQAKRDLQRYKRSARLAARKGESVLEPLLTLLEPKRFYFGEQSSNNYTASWLFVHFLLHHQDGLYRAGLLEFVDGQTFTAQALLDALGVSMEQLESEFMSYLGELRARA